MTRHAEDEVAALLHELFDVEELRAFLRRHYREVADYLPVHLGRIPLANAAAEALARRNLVDAALFARLRDARGRCAPRIQQAARTWTREAAAAPRRKARAAAAAVGCAAVGAATFVLVRPDGEAPTCEDGPPCAAPAERPGEARTDARTARPLVCPDGMVLVAGPDSPLCFDRSEVTRDAFCSHASTRANLKDRYTAARCMADEAVVADARHPVAYVSPAEAEVYCAARGLRLPERREFVHVLRAELGGRTPPEILDAINMCGVECFDDDDRDKLATVRVDAFQRTAPVGSFRAAFASPQGLDDMFGNVREVVREGTRAFACGSGWVQARPEDLRPELCTDPDNPPLASDFTHQNLGFRCVGAPHVAP